jgi:ATP/maltotriose-dependent transcriptional regulator MalT/DNA-binding SARP family transcriptional activator
VSSKQSAASIAEPFARPVVPSFIDRQRLYDQLDGRAGIRGTWISGPPGAGKTTLVSSYLTRHPCDHIWLRVSAAEADPAALFLRLAKIAYARSVSDFPVFTPEAALALASFARRAFAALLEPVDDPFLLVLDDWHEIPDDGITSDLLPVLVKSLPARARLIGISRRAQPPSLARSMLNGEIHRLTNEQLAFDQSEALALAKLVGSPLAEHDVDIARRHSCGWAAGLRIQLERGFVFRDGNASMARTDDVAYDYFAKEVFDRATPVEQDFFLRTAIAPWVNGHLANALTGLTNSADLLRGLAGRGWFVSIRDATRGEYEYHLWFRQFLIERMCPALGAEELARLGRRAASVFEAAAELDCAARVLNDGDLLEELGKFLVRGAPTLLAQGRHQTLAKWLDRLPAPIIEVDPWLLYWRGESVSMCSPGESLKWHERAYELFSATADSAGMLLSWSGIADAIFRDYGTLSRLDQWIARFDDTLAPMFDAAVPRIRARVIGSIFPVLSFRQPKHPRLPQLVAEVRQIIKRFETPGPAAHLLIHLHAHCLWTGDLADAVAAIEQLRMIRQRPFPSPLAEAGYHLCEATHALFLGEFRDCLAAIESGLQVANATGVHIWDTVMLGHGAAVASSQGDPALEEEFLGRIRDSMIPAQHHERSRLHLARAWFAARLGQYRLAQSEATTGIALENENGVPSFMACANLIAGMTFALCNEPARARAHTERVLEAGARLQNPMLQWIGSLAASYVEHRLGDYDSALRHLRSGMRVGAAEGYRHFLFWPRDSMATVCALALQNDIEVDYVVGLAKLHRFAAPVEAEFSERWPWPVVVRTLGLFSVEVGGAPIQSIGKTQRVPMRLLKFLIARGGLAVPNQDVIDHLWPDAEGDAGEQSLATTLNRLRQLVGNATIQRGDRRLTIDPRSCWVDALALRRLLEPSPSVAGRETLDRIRALARGRFLSGEVEASWALPLREKLHHLLVQRLLEIGKTAQDLGNHGLASEAFRFGLEVDELVEAFYRGLMVTNIRQGEYSQALLLFRRCERVLRAHLGVDVSTSTLELRELASRHRSR